MNILDIIKDCIEQRKEEEQRRHRAEMCRKSIDIGTCPKACDECPWSSYRRRNQ